MAYLLDLIAPGLGHLASGRWRSGAALLFFWMLGEVTAFLAISFQVWAFLAMPLFWAGLSLLAVIDLFRLRRKRTVEPAGCLKSLLLLPVGPVLGVALALAVTSTLVRPMRVRSGSMTPSAVTGDTIVVQMFGPRLFGVHLGDIVLVAHPNQLGRLLIKRIIGVAGDLIQIRGGELLRNGRLLADCELRSLRDHETGQQVHERLEVLEGRPYLVWDQPAVRSKAISVRVPEGHLFVMGDNRDRSGDSRSFGTVPISLVRGRVTTRIAPVPTNEIFRAPLKARQAAFQRCSKQGSPSRVTQPGESSTDQSRDGAFEKGSPWPVYRGTETKRR